MQNSVPLFDSLLFVFIRVHSWLNSCVEKLFDIIHEDEELLVIDKPAGLVCHPTKTDEYSSLISRVRLYLAKAHGSGDVLVSESAGTNWNEVTGTSPLLCRPHLVNRLDRETSGVTVVAKRDESARELRRMWEDRQVEKEYLALVHGHVAEASGVIDAPLGKDEQSRVVIKDCVRADGAAARTEFWVVNSPESTVHSPESKDVGDGKDSVLTGVNSKDVRDGRDSVLTGVNSKDVRDGKDSVLTGVKSKDVRDGKDSVLTG
ncbi:MAG: rRNA synthase, partial [Verrucomicrobiota bacterium]